ncbi:MAG TPA: hypothetical protein VGG28_00435 [Kofleriaceae bacterium]|jgi:hypothetical protein
MRYLLATTIALAACEPAAMMNRPIDDDVDAPACDSGQFQIVAPVEGEHYDASLDALVDETALWTQLIVTITDDIGDSYLPTAESTTYDRGVNHDTYHFELAASTRYTLAVGHCTTIQTVGFFTSP